MLVQYLENMKPYHTALVKWKSEVFLLLEKEKCTIKANNYVPVMIDAIPVPAPIYDKTTYKTYKKGGGDGAVHINKGWLFPVFRIRIHLIQIRISIQHFKLNNRVPIWIRIQGFDDKKFLKNLQLFKNFTFLW